MSLLSRVRTIAYVFIYLSVFVFASSKAFADSKTISLPTKKEWTILVYLNGDNNLEDAAYDDVREMEKVGTTSQVNIVVQLDGLSPKGTKRFLVQKNTGGNLPTAAVNNTPTPSPDSDSNWWGSSSSDSDHTFFSPVLEDMPEQDMGDPEVFTDFVEWGMDHYPAKKYFVILWNHGSGWDKDRNDLLVKGVSYDDTSGHHITTNQLADAVDAIEADTENRINILGFDACLMAMYEIADSLSGMVDYLVASEETIPLDGYPYDEFLTSFVGDADKSPQTLLKKLVKAYGDSYSGGSQGTSSVTLSAVDLNQLELVKRRFNQWIRVMQDKAPLAKSSLLEAADETVNFQEADYRDLGDFIHQILKKSVTADESKPSKQFEKGAKVARDGLIGASMALNQAIESAVIAKFASSKFSRSTGLSIHLPYGYGGYSSWSSTYNDDKKKMYLGLKWAATTRWPAFLDQLFKKDEATPSPSPNNEMPEVFVPLPTISPETASRF